ncbi:MAG: type ISP restriction/modification enzyme [Rhizobiaceae bacterium]
MSKILVNQFLNELDKLKKFSGSLNEQVIRGAFMDLLKAWSKQNDLHFVPELDHLTPLKTTVYPDGTILHDLRVPLGYWEAKDTKDDLDVEIAKKLKAGYPQDNIIYENSAIAVLWQNGGEVLRCEMQDVDELLKLLALFFSYERQEIADFRRAVEQFRTDLPAVLDALRDKINDAYAANTNFKASATQFLKHAKETINPAVGEADVREMLIQHILTEEIFAHVFNEGDFHRENNIAKELYQLESEFFTGAVKKNTLKTLEPYYAAIRANAAQITSHNQKQTFLKVIYENFYKVYNPKAADRLGVVYTPNEIVRFMIEGADWLTQKHFGKALIDRDVEILDPATGTGTFICELLEHFRGQPEKLAHKYKNELHANEVAILPYYVANLNIEATYAAISGQFAEFPNLCFVDTLDNVGGLGIRAGHQHSLFAGLADENMERVKRQNRRKISVVIGNPPYNVGQLNELNANKNREYKQIDESIGSSYVKQSSAQKTLVYDMYSRFFRWATDRLHDDGVIAFITNRSFIDSRTFDGFRKDVVDQFSEIYIMDLGGDVRANPRLSGTKNNVFGIQTGVCISFFVKKQLGRKQKPPANIFYARRPEMDTADDKLSFISTTSASSVHFEHIRPSIRGNWINHIVNEWEDLIPVGTKAEKSGKKGSKDRAIFQTYSTGIMSGRDDWVGDFNEKILKTKVQYMHEEIAELQPLSDRERLVRYEKTDIKLSETIRAKIENSEKFSEQSQLYRHFLFRPFIKKFVYGDTRIVDRLTGSHADFFDKNLQETLAIGFLSVHSAHPLSVISATLPFDYGILKSGNGGTQTLPRHRYSKSGEKIDNITDWGLNQFVKHYGRAAKITKNDIFHYVYAVLHDPVYRETYAINLKREFPRIPFYPDFRQWVTWGKVLLDGHINYETIEPWSLERLDREDVKARSAGVSPKAMLKADKDNGTIHLDTETQLTGIPPEVWTYKLGNRSGMEWILDQYKEKTPRDPTIREKFNTYRFADYKEKVVDLLMRVTRVSVETVAITNAMAALDRSDWDAKNDT